MFRTSYRAPADPAFSAASARFLPGAIGMASVTIAVLMLTSIGVNELQEPPSRFVASVTVPDPLAATEVHSVTPAVEFDQNAVAVPPATPFVMPGPPPSTHTVVDGDSIETIAARYGRSVEELLKANRLPDDAVLSEGEVVTLPKARIETSYDERRGPNYTDRVVLTYDDCPASLENFTAVITTARENNIGLVLAPTGKCIAQFEADHGVNLVDMAREQGQYVINHSVNHLDLTRMGCDEVAAELGAPGVVTNFARPPFGAINSAVLCGLDRKQMTPWLWNVDTRDWAVRSGPAIIEHVITHAYPGSTVLMHLNWAGFDPSALREIRDGLSLRGIDLCRAYPGTDDVNTILASPVMLPSALPC